MFENAELFEQVCDDVRQDMNTMITVVSEANYWITRYVTPDMLPDFNRVTGLNVSNKSDLYDLVEAAYTCDPLFGQHFGSIMILLPVNDGVPYLTNLYVAHLDILTDDQKRCFLNNLNATLVDINENVAKMVW